MFRKIIATSATWFTIPIRLGLAAALRGRRRDRSRTVRAPGAAHVHLGRGPVREHVDEKPPVRLQPALHPGQQGGLHVMRDIPRYVKLIEKGKIDATSVITKKYTLDESRQAVQDTADRTIITGVIEFA